MNDKSNGIEVRINGKVQGVGFRPYVWQLAQSCGLRGNVSNNSQGVTIHLWQGQEQQPIVSIAKFLENLPKNCPPLARIQTLQTSAYHWEKEPTEFKIIHSSGGQVQTHIVPDATTCPACLAELNNPADRRYHYPFINCTHCGPRFTIVERIPYDRENTSMKVFPLCSKCQAEYEDPANRRFHAQPNACPVCGPHVFLCQQDGVTLARDDDAIQQASDALEQGQIIALKGLGGFHLACDALSPTAVEHLRQRKTRPSKPLAVMLPNEHWLRRCIHTEQVDELAQLLCSPTAPIVLVQQHPQSPLCPAVTPHLNEVGIMLPANPLQHLLLQKINRPLVMTSGNARGKPPAMRNEEALFQLKDIANLWLMHNRDIVQRVDDSVIRFTPTESASTETLRRARGYVPDALPVPQGFHNNPAILAMGGDLKNAFCILRKDNAVMSQHFGDLEDLDIQQQVRQSITIFQNIYQFMPEAIAIDAHPAYISHQLGKAIAKELHIPTIEVMHHHAHIASCMAENGHTEKAGAVIGLALDGLGYGENGALWGGECLAVDYHQFQHLGGLPAVALPGGDLASRQPWRNLLAHFLHFVPDWQNRPEATGIPLEQVPVLERAIERGLNSPKASSAGRLFDAVAAALGIAPHTLSWEGEAACQLEALACQCQNLALMANSPVTMPIITANTASSKKYTLDLATFWAQWLQWQATAAERAYAFHHALARSFAELAQLAATQHQSKTIALSGGVIHNALLRRLLLEELKGFNVLIPSILPAGDGGLAYGQALIAAPQLSYR